MHQDWEQVTLAKGRPKAAEGRRGKEAEITAASRKDDVTVQKKFLGGQNKQHAMRQAPGADDDTGDYHVDKVSHSFARSLQTARLNKGLTQAKLAQAISEKASLIADYEAERAVPNPTVVSKLGRILGVKLPPVKQKRPPVSESTS